MSSVSSRQLHAGLELMVVVPPTSAPHWPQCNSALSLSAEFSPLHDSTEESGAHWKAPGCFTRPPVREILKIDTIWTGVKEQAHAQVVHLIWHHVWKINSLVMTKCHYFFRVHLKTRCSDYTLHPATACSQPRASSRCREISWEFSILIESPFTQQ